MGWRCLRRDRGWKPWGESWESSSRDPGAESPPDGNSLCAQADYSHPSGNRLRGSNSPVPKRDSALALWCLSLTAEYKVTRLITKEDRHRCKPLAKVEGQSGLEMLEERLGMEALGRELREWQSGSQC